MADKAVNWPNVFSDFGGAAADLFGASANNSKANADFANARAAKVTGDSFRLKSQGDLIEGEAYGKAAGLADLNAQFTEQSTAIQTAQADRALFGVLGGIKSDIASSGFGEGGLITEAGYKEQEQSFRSLQTVAGFASQQDELAAQGQDIAAQKYMDAAAADQKAAKGNDISAIIKGIAGFAGILEGNPAGILDVFSAAKDGFTPQAPNDPSNPLRINQYAPAEPGPSAATGGLY